MLNEGKSKQILLSVLGVAILVVAVVGISYAAFQTTQTGETNSVTTGTILMAYSEPSANLTITNATNQATSAAYAGANHFDFSVTATTNAVIAFPYEVSVTPRVASNADFEAQVRIGLKRNGAIVANGGYNIGDDPADYTNGIFVNTLVASTARPTNSKVLYKGTLTTALSEGTTYTATDNFQVFLWIDQQALLGADEEEYSITVNVDASAAPLS